MSKRIEIIVDQKGNVIITPHGYSGPACEQATREIEEALGDVTSHERTHEFYARSETRARLTTDA